MFCCQGETSNNTGINTNNQTQTRVKTPTRRGVLAALKAESRGAGEQTQSSEITRSHCDAIAAFCVKMSNVQGVFLAKK